MTDHSDNLAQLEAQIRAAATGHELNAIAQRIGHAHLNPTQQRHLQAAYADRVSTLWPSLRRRVQRHAKWHPDPEEAPA